MNYSYLYADANLFIAYFNNEPTRADILDQIFEEIEADSKRKLLTSVMTITEVSKFASEKRKAPLSEAFETLSDGIWKNADLIELVDVSETAARRARSLIREFMPHGLQLKTQDAIHLATAKILSVPMFLTYDDKLLNYGSLLGLNIVQPSVNQPRLM